MKKAGILAFTKAGRELATEIASHLSKEWDVEFDESGGTSPAEYVRNNFAGKDALVFVGAAGIAVRMIAPYVVSKDKDPAVIVIDEKGEYVIPILSGHLGGANALAVYIAEILKGKPVITTATDVNGKFAIDVWTSANNCVITDISNIKIISGAILRGEKVGFDPGNFEIVGDMPKELTLDRADSGVCISLSGDVQKYDTTLNAVPKIITVGVGCRKDTSDEDFETLLIETLKGQRISLLSVAKIASVNIKSQEKCILDFCRKYGIPFVTYSAEELMAVKGDFRSSDFVKSVTGADNICERSAVLSSGGKLLINREVKDGITIAVAIREWECRF